MLNLLRSLGLPIDGSRYGNRIDITLAGIHWVMAILFVGWTLFFVYALIRFRSSSNPRASYRGMKFHVALWTMLAVAGVEIFIEAKYSVPFWAHRVDEFPSEDESTVVRVVAQQFAWNFHYPGPDGVFGETSVELVSQDNVIGLDRDDPNAADDLVSINEFHVPVGKPVIARLSSMDVIHSFSLPEMRVKQDIIPGMRIPVWFVPEMTSEEFRQAKIERGDATEEEAAKLNYTVACAQLCGLAHYRMRGAMTVESQEEFDAWYEEEIAYFAEDDDWADDDWEEEGDEESEEEGDSEEEMTEDEDSEGVEEEDAVEEETNEAEAVEESSVEETAVEEAVTEEAATESVEEATTNDAGVSEGSE